MRVLVIRSCLGPLSNRVLPVGVATLILFGNAVLSRAGQSAEAEAFKIIPGTVVDETGAGVAGAEVWLPVKKGFRPEDDRTAHAVADAQGRFELRLPLSWLDDRLMFFSAWAYAPGRQIGSASVYSFLREHDKTTSQAKAKEEKDEKPEEPTELVIVLNPATGVSFDILGPDGRPLPGATVQPQHVKTRMAYEFVPGDMLPKVSAVTGDDGRAELPAVPSDKLYSIRVETEAFGVQTVRVQGRSGLQDKIRLRAAGSIRGRIVAENPKAVSGVYVALTTSDPGDRYGQRSPQGMALVFSHDDGTFEVPTIATGSLSVYAKVDEAVKLRPRLPENVTVSANRTTELQIPLVQPVTVRGIIRVMDTGKPLAGAVISVSYGVRRQSEHVTSDANGQFTAYALPGTVRTQVIRMPGPYVRANHVVVQSHEVPEDAGEFELPPIEVVSTRSLKGRMVDEHDHPVAEAGISLIVENRRYGYGKTGTDGRFTLSGIPETLTLDDVEYEIHVESEERKKAEVVSAEPLLLRIKPSMIPEEGAILSGRVVDQEGLPVAGAQVRLSNKMFDPESGRLRGSRTITFGGQSYLATGDDGRFQTPHAVERPGTYRALVREGYVTPAGSEWIEVNEDESTASFGDLVVQRLHAIEGIVTDEAGKPLSGVTVANRGNAAPFTEVVSGADGRFRLPGIPQGKVLLFVDAPGRPFRGETVDTKSGSVKLVVPRSDTTQVAKPATPSPPMDRAEAMELARRIIKPYAEKVLAQDDKQLRGRVLEALTHLDPEAAWEKMQSGDPVWDSDSARRALFQRLQNANPEDALAVAKSIESGYWRLSTVLDYIDALPDNRRDEKLQLLADALVETRAIERPGYRLAHQMRIVEQLLDLGQRDAARQLVDECSPLARNLDSPEHRLTYTRLVAANLARIDVDAALDLVDEDAEEREQADCRALIAREIAATNPQKAEEVIRRIDSYYSHEFLAHACRRMVRVDARRAQDLIAGENSSGVKAFVLGRMAGEVAQSDRKLARELIEDSFRSFDDAIARGLRGLWGTECAAYMAASLLPVVEKIDPRLVPEYVWRTVALRWLPRKLDDLTHTYPDTSRVRSLESDATLAIFLAPYDPELARTILQPILETMLNPPEDLDWDRLNHMTIWMAVALIMPEHAVKVIEAQPEPEGLSRRELRNSALMTIAEALAVPRDEAVSKLRRWTSEFELLDRVR